MKKLTYNEFGVCTEISQYKKIGSKLKGMRDGKPFTQGDEIRVNIDGDLYLVEEVAFYNEAGESLERKDVCLDTENRIAGVIVNAKNQVLLLHRIFADLEYFGFPGGHRRECESVEECLKREMIEETGIDISGLKTELLMELHEDGFGPEMFFLIKIGDNEIVFENEDPADNTSKLEIESIDKVIGYENLHPEKIVKALHKLSSQ